jgi:ferritin-like metal-binding protein YciE
MATAFTFISNHRHNMQTPFEECFEALGEAHEENVFGAIERLVAAGEQVGLTVHDLIRMLKGGMSLEALLDVIEVRMTRSCVHSESRAA